MAGRYSASSVQRRQRCGEQRPLEDRSKRTAVLFAELRLILGAKHLLLDLVDINFVVFDGALYAGSVLLEQRLTNVLLVALQVVIGEPGIETLVVFALQLCALRTDALHYGIGVEFSGSQRHGASDRRSNRSLLQFATVRLVCGMATMRWLANRQWSVRAREVR